MSEQSESLVPSACARAALATCVTLGLLLSGCGQKGSLTLALKPKSQAIVPTVPTVSAPAASPASAPPPRTWGSPPP